jgi:hypothetical protein
MPSIQDQLPVIPRPATSQARLAKVSSWTFALYIALLPVMQCGLSERLDPTPIIADAVFVVLCFLFVIALIRKELPWRSSGFYFAIGFYAIAIVSSEIAAASPNRHYAGLVVEAYLLVIALLTFNLICSEAVLKLILQAWMVGTAITVLAAIAGAVLFYSGVRQGANIFLSTYGTLVPGNYPRVRGLFLNMNMCCNYLSISFVLLLAMVSVGWIEKRTAVVLGGGILVAAFFTFSLGLGGLALGTCIWMWVHSRERGRTRSTRTALAIGVLIALTFVGATLVSPSSLYDSSGRLHLEFAQLKPSGRVLCWRDALHTALQNQWFGKGPGAPVAAVNLVTPSGEQQFLTDAHNTFLSIASHDGLFGLATFCALLIFVLRKPNLQTSGKPYAVIHTAAWIGLVQALLYQGIAGSWEHTRHIWVLIGLVAALQLDGPELVSPLKVQSRQADEF